MLYSAVSYMTLWNYFIENLLGVESIVQRWHAFYNLVVSCEWLQKDRTNLFCMKVPDSPSLQLVLINNNLYWVILIYLFHVFGAWFTYKKNNHWFPLLCMCQDRYNPLIVFGQGPFKIRWVGQDTLCYHLIKRPFTSGQVISTTDSKIPLWLVQMTLVPVWCAVSTWLSLLVLCAVWASVPTFPPLPTQVPHHHHHLLAPLAGCLLCTERGAAPASSQSQAGSLCHPLTSCPPGPNLTRWVLGDISWILSLCGFLTFKNNTPNKWWGYIKENAFVSSLIHSLGVCSLHTSWSWTQKLVR